VVTIAREDRPGDTRIVAYIVPRGAMPAASELRDHIRAMLPIYMVPQHFVHIEAVPLLPNGKLDRTKLPQAGDASEDAPAAPASLHTELERGIAAIWQRLLGVDSVDRADNFFDLGGHSLLAMRAVSQIEELLGVTISPRRLIFETLAQLAATPDATNAPDAPQAADAKPGLTPGKWRLALKRLFGDAS
jgi:acyl carrier protein